MTNYSNLSRKEQVFSYLRTRLNAWVDGTELANERVGGSEGLKRLRELRQDLAETRFDIEMRSHPDPQRSIFQYRLIERPWLQPAEPGQLPYEKQPEAVRYPAAGAPAPVQAADGPPAERSPQRLNALDRRGTHLAWDPATETYIAVYDGPVPEVDPKPLPGQLDMGVPEVEGHKYTRKPEKLELGRSIPCPMCHGIHRAIKEKDPVTGKAAKGGKILGYEELTRNPNRPSEDCPRCNGFGLIPA